MRQILLALALSPSLAAAGVLNVEFKFTPFTGDTKEDHFESVPGTARVLLNGVPYAEQPVQEQTLPDEAAFAKIRATRSRCAPGRRSWRCSRRGSSP
jgi:hypothetical protein